MKCDHCGEPLDVHASDCLKALVLKHSWVNVAERLPEGGTRALAWAVDHEGGAAIVMHYNAKFGWTSPYRCGTVTHWMPLPEAPK